MKQELILRDRPFVVTSATLRGRVADPYWCDVYNRGAGKTPVLGLDINTAESAVEGEPWAPSIYHQTLAFPGRDWRAIAGRVVRWEQPTDAQSGELNGGFYVWEHAEIPRAELRFGALSSLSFEIEWSGACHVHWDADFGANVPFRVRALAAFTGVTVLGSEKDDAASLRARLDAYLRADDFMQGEVKRGGAYDNGVGTTSCFFTPKSA